MIEATHKRRQTIMLGLALVVSFWIHILGMALWRYAEPQLGPPPPPPIALEIELPQDLVMEEQPPESTKIPPEEEPPPLQKEQTVPLQPAVGPIISEGDRPGEPEPGSLPPLEDTISLENKAPKYISYLGKIKLAISRHWIFPPAARQNRISGRLSAVFTIDRSGQLIKIVVQESSGNPILDHAALEAVRGAAPFGAFPPHLNIERLNIIANFDYRIRYISTE